MRGEKGKETERRRKHWGRIRKEQKKPFTKKSKGEENEKKREGEKI